MKKIILICILILVLLVVGCENVDVSKLSDEDLERISEKAVVCNKPYMRIGTECCLDTDSNAICDSDEIKKTQLSETEVVEAYLKHIAVQNIDEDIASIKDSLKYVTGYAKEDLSETLRYFNEQKRIFNEFYNQFWIECKKIDTLDACKKAQQSFLDTFNSAFKRDVNIITIELKEKGKSVHNEREEITPIRKQTVVKDYLLKKKNNEWKIYDWINDKGDKWSDIPIKEIKLQNDKSIKELKETYDWALKTIQETIEKQATQTEVKKDKCSYVDELKGLTTVELEAEYQICYNGKYINYVYSTDNPKVCEEIVKAWYYSPCIASVASKRNDVNLCKNVKYEEWEGKGYYEKLNTKDVCYYYFVYYTYINLSESEIENTCNKISNEQIKTQCLAFKELSLAIEELGSLFSDDLFSDEEEEEATPSQPEREEWEELIKFEGKGNKDTESIQVDGVKVKMVARTWGGSVGTYTAIDLESEDGDYLGTGLSISTEGAEEGKGETIIRRVKPNKKYYVSVISGVNWEVTLYVK